MKQGINRVFNNEQMVISSNGFTRTSLSATVTRVSHFVEENVFLILHRQGSRPGAFSHALPNMSNIVMHSACSNH